MAEILETRLAVQRWWAAPITLILRWAQSFCARQAFRALDDQTLKDIGLRRGDIYRIVADMERGR